jgi:uncharacterized protein (DUF2141 family)
MLPLVVAERKGGAYGKHNKLANSRVTSADPIRIELRTKSMREAAMRYVAAFLGIPCLLTSLCATAIVPTQTAAIENVIHVEISGFHSDKGKAMCALYSSADGFPGKAEKAVAKIKSDIAGGQAVCEFSAIAPGTYAVSVFHDENSNGKLDRNFIGMPKEGVGASNNAKGHMGPPKFDAAKFSFSGSRLNLKIGITYL